MAAYREDDVVELIARQKCYDVLTRYCRALDRADPDLMRSVYWEDGIDDHGVFTGNAHEFADFIIQEIQNWFEVTMHSISNVHMEYYGDVMCTESYLTAYHKVKGEQDKIEAVQGSEYYSKLNLAEIGDTHHVFFYGGRYVDRLEKRGDEWRISLRRVVMDWNEHWPGLTILEDGMSKNLTLRGCRGHEDPVFQNKP